MSMLQEFSLWEKKIKDGIELANDFYAAHGSRLPKNIRKILFVGMGGSGIAGRIFKMLLESKPGLLVTTVDSSTLPGHVDTDTLAIVTSYSGNTWETLDVLDALTAKFIPTIVMAHGGKAIEKAEVKNLPFVLLPESLTPRSSLGTTIGFLSTFFEKMGIASTGQWALDWIDVVKKYAPAFAESRYFEDFLNFAQGADFFYVLGVTGDSAAAAYRAATQFHENSKIPAAYAEYPEMAHNLLVGLGMVQNPPRVLVLHTDFLAPRVQAGIRVMSDILKEKRVALYKPPVLGDNFEQQLFAIVLWADFASYHLATARGVDIVRVAVIEDLKRRQQINRI